MRSGPKLRLSAQAAEALVAAALVRAGWRIAARNARHIGYEIDLVATKGRTLIVVEVKARRRPPSSAADASALLPHRKLEALRRGALMMLARHGRHVSAARIDLAVVHPAPGARSASGISYYVDVYPA